MSELPEPSVVIEKPIRKKASLAVMALMALNILLGLGVAVGGHFLLQSDGMALVGGALATLAAVLMLSYLLWGDKR